MKSTVLLTSALVLALLVMASLASAQKCTEGASCVVGGKKGSVSCAGGHAKCVPDPDLGEGPLCGSTTCAAGNVCQDNKCVSSCKPGFTECDGTCRDLGGRDPRNCGACGNVCRSGTSCQVSAGGGICACTPPSISCGGICRNPTNDPENCGACGNVCSAPNTACRNSQCVPPEVPPSSGGAGSTGNLPLDLVWSKRDPNGLPFNPDWRAHSDPALLVDGTYVDLAKACPACQPDPKCLARCIGNPAGCNICVPPPTCWQRCTTFPVTSDGGLLCGSAHINWIRATYAGKLEFDDYSARGLIHSIFEDDDYTFNLRPTDEAGNENGAGLAGRPELHPEMAFLETVAHFQSKFWSNFRDLVDNIPGEDLSGPRALFAGRHAIVIGLQGLDTQHQVHEELHPIYAIALRETEKPNEDPTLVTENPNRDCWAIFARNWGNEGFCSNHDHPLDLNHITFHLPQPFGATAVREISREFKTSNDSLVSVSEVGRVEDGAEITITLGPTDNRTFVNGEVCLNWAVPPGVQPPAQPARVAARAPRPVVPEVEKDEFPGIDLLTPAQLAQLKRSFPAPPSPDKRLGMQEAKRVPFVRDLAKAQGPAVTLGDRVGAVDAQKQARDRQIQTRVCQMLRGHPKRPKECDKL